MSDHRQVEALVARVEERLGPIEVAVHVAGVIQVGPWSSLSREHFEEAMGTMAWGPINLASAVAPRMRERGRG
ncbi:MAG: SDR family oxidoreductase, partial [Lapillicoccus sp.]